MTDSTWRYAITNKGATAEVLLYDDIGYGGITADAFARDLQDITAGRIELRVNSCGGEIFDGLAIYEALKRHKAHVTVYVDGLAASAASFIAMAGDRIVTARNAEWMIHDAQGMAVGDSTRARDMAALLDRLSDNIADIYAQRAGGTAAEWRERMKAETWYTASEAVAAGLSDEVAGSADGEQVAAKVKGYRIAASARNSQRVPVLVRAAIARELPRLTTAAVIARAALSEVGLSTNWELVTPIWRACTGYAYAQLCRADR